MFCTVCVSLVHIQKLHHHLNCLSSENKAARKSALLSLKRLLSQTSCKEDELDVSHEDVIKALLVAISDKSEACRDIGISVLQGLVFLEHARQGIMYMLYNFIMA